MTYKFILTEDDFLIHQLYASSVSAQVKRDRKRTQTIVPILYLTVSALFFALGNAIIGFMFIIASISWYLFYPIRQSKHYKKQYTNHVREQFSAMFNQPVSISFDGAHYYDNSHASELKLPLSELIEIVELQTLILIKASSGFYLIISKNTVNDKNSLISELKQLATQLNIPYKEELNWRWK